MLHTIPLVDSRSRWCRATGTCDASVNHRADQPGARRREPRPAGSAAWPRFRRRAPDSHRRPDRRRQGSAAWPRFRRRADRPGARRRSPFRRLRRTGGARTGRAVPARLRAAGGRGGGSRHADRHRQRRLVLRRRRSRRAGVGSARLGPRRRRDHGGSGTSRTRRHRARRRPRAAEGRRLSRPARAGARRADPCAAARRDAAGRLPGPAGARRPGRRSDRGVPARPFPPRRTALLPAGLALVGRRLRGGGGDHRGGGP